MEKMEKMEKMETMETMETMENMESPFQRDCFEQSLLYFSAVSQCYLEGRHKTIDSACVTKVKRRHAAFRAHCHNGWSSPNELK